MIVFTIDNTLAPVGKPISSATKESLKLLEKNGYKIMFLSHYSSAYIKGLIRCIGLEDCVIVGERGGVFHSSLKPALEDLVRFQYSDEHYKQLLNIEAELMEKHKSYLTIEPYEINFGFYVKQENKIDEVKSSLEELIDEYHHFRYYQYGSYFEVVPENVRMDNAVHFSRFLLDINKEEVITVGSTEEDSSIFKESIVSIGLQQEKATHVVNSQMGIFETLNKILKINDNE
jgi:hydroxymethylpyrimidine pyrophosphatase-like HAD family hydrolase